MLCRSPSTQFTCSVEDTFVCKYFHLNSTSQQVEAFKMSRYFTGMPESEINMQVVKMLCKLAHLHPPPPQDPHQVISTKNSYERSFVACLHGLRKNRHCLIFELKNPYIGARSKCHSCFVPVQESPQVLSEAGRYCVAL